ncbi:MAG TPA: PspA/IM30 family protein [Ktedonobacteraceae bacterium]
MNLLERVLTLLRANLNTMAEKSDDPEKTLRQLQQDMRNQLVQVKTQVATAISGEMQLQKRSKEFQSEANLWLKKAEQAVQQNNENAARDYLARYNDLVRQAQRYEQQRKEQEQLVATMRGILRQLEAKISEVDTTIELLASRKRSALLQQRVYDTLSKSGSPTDKERAERAQDKLLEVEARARALADLQQRDLDTQLARISQEQIIEGQLQQLKQKQQLPTPEVARQLDGQANSEGPTPEKSVPRKKRSAGLPNTGELAPSPPEAIDMDLERLKRLMGM